MCTLVCARGFTAADGQSGNVTCPAGGGVVTPAFSCKPGMLQATGRLRAKWHAVADFCSATRYCICIVVTASSKGAEVVSVHCSDMHGDRLAGQYHGSLPERGNGCAMHTTWSACRSTVQQQSRHPGRAGPPVPYNGRQYQRRDSQVPYTGQYVTMAICSGSFDNVFFHQSINIDTCGLATQVDATAARWPHA